MHPPPNRVSALEPIAVHTVEKILASDPWQQWQAFAALFGPPAHGQAAPGGVGAADRFKAAAQAYLDGASRASTGAPAGEPAPVQAARMFADSVRELFADFPQPWTSAFGAHPVSNAASAAHGSPALGAGRDHQQRWQRMSDAWRRLEDAQRKLQRHWSDALREAGTAFALKLGSVNPTGATPEAAGRLYDTWIDCAEDAYARAAHSESFCDALAEFVNAGSDWRKDLQASVEHSAKTLDLPTRSEVNTLTERIRSLEAELRALRATADSKSVKTKTARRKSKP
jgi:polyhydroxyalkanoate synthase subunit PhaE